MRQIENVQSDKVGREVLLPSDSLKDLVVPPARDERTTKVEVLWKELLRSKPGPTNDDLCYIIKSVEPLREQAWKQLLSQEPSNGDLCSIIKSVEPLREQAWKQLLSQEPSNDDLCSIIKSVEPLREQAWKQ